MIVANILLIPFRPSQMDLDTMLHLSDLIDTAKGLNENLISLAVINMASTNHLVAEVKEAQEYLQEFPIIKLLNSVIHERKIYRDVVPTGEGVVDTDHTKAKDEIENLVGVAPLAWAGCLRAAVDQSILAQYTMHCN